MKGSTLQYNKKVKKNITHLQQQQQHEEKDAVKKRQHETKIETKKSETAIAEIKIKPKLNQNTV